ncbi:MAG: 3-phosphoshikimate 1-carboxyvinyltransferase [Gemmataceae bacterium]|nr:3-phosphoshikimate 1-carboxyvinyltransferase [Gemmataceae bacterium]
MNSRAYPDRLAIEPISRPAYASVSVPGSKSMTNRALVLAALASQSGPGLIHGALQCDDSEVMIESLGRLGFEITVDWHNERISVAHHSGALIPADHADLFCDNSGTTMRFLTALVAAGRGRFRLDGSPRMRERPMGDLLAALRQLGVRAESESANDCPPIVVESHGLQGGDITIRGDTSSQYLSALLMVAPLAAGPVMITVDGPLVSRPYVDMTIAQMADHGLTVEQAGNALWAIAPQAPRAAEVIVEADASAASYFFAAAAILQSTVMVGGYIPELITQQGDIRFLDLLREMGCLVRRDLVWNVVHGQPLRGIDVDMNDISDTVMTLAAVACFAKGPTTIRNVAHIRHKESDRIAALATELRKLGVKVNERPDGLTITPGPMHGAELETYNDHRMAMSLALIGLRVPGIVIKNPGCVAKTYPGFWDDLASLKN